MRAKRVGDEAIYDVLRDEIVSSLFVQPSPSPKGILYNLLIIKVW